MSNLSLPAVSAIAIALSLSACSNAAESVASSESSIDVEKIAPDYFIGEWCLVRSTKDGADESPNLNFRFTTIRTLAFERATGSGKFGTGSYSWKPEANLFLLNTPPTLMRTAKVASATEDSFTLGGKIGYTFERGVCSE